MGKLDLFAEKFEAFIKGFGSIVLGVGIIAFLAAIPATILYVIIHFIIKWW